ncbi:MAG: ABC transporter permease [Proteobacteria bacterium]|nr:ABC transporter permease [Pseudomonadota bacterium]
MFIVLLALWETIVRGAGVPAYLVPAPSVIWLQSTAIVGDIAGHTLATLHTVAIGFGVSVVISIPLAVLLTSSQVVASAVYPLIVLTQSIPKVALAPILVVALGANQMPRVIVAFLVAFFPLLMATVAGLLSTPPELIELGRSYKASRLQEVFRIRIPFSTPFIFSGLKAAIVLSVTGTVAGEFVASDRGLGHLIIATTAFFQTPIAFGALILLSIMGIALFQLVAVVQRVFFAWSTGEEAKAK